MIIGIFIYLWYLLKTRGFYQFSEGGGKIAPVYGIISHTMYTYKYIPVARSWDNSHDCGVSLCTIIAVI